MRAGEWAGGITCRVVHATTTAPTVYECGPLEGCRSVEKGPVGRFDLSRFCRVR